MAKKVYAPGEAYNYQLLIKHILEMPLAFAPNQEIVYRDKGNRLTDSSWRLFQSWVSLGQSVRGSDGWRRVL